MKKRGENNTNKPYQSFESKNRFENLRENKSKSNQVFHETPPAEAITLKDLFTYPTLVAGRLPSGKRASTLKTPNDSKGFVARVPKITTGRVFDLDSVVRRAFHL